MRTNRAISARVSIHVTRAPTVPLTSDDTKRLSHLKESIYGPKYTLPIGQIRDGRIDSDFFEESILCDRFCTTGIDSRIDSHTKESILKAFLNI